MAVEKHPGFQPLAASIPRSVDDEKPSVLGDYHKRFHGCDLQAIDYNWASVQMHR